MVIGLWETSSLGLLEVVCVGNGFEKCLDFFGAKSDCLAMFEPK